MSKGKLAMGTQAGVFRDRARHGHAYGDAAEVRTASTVPEWQAATNDPGGRGASPVTAGAGRTLPPSAGGHASRSNSTTSPPSARRGTTPRFPSAVANASVPAASISGGV